MYMVPSPTSGLASDRGYRRSMEKMDAYHRIYVADAPSAHVECEFFLRFTLHSLA